MNDGTDGYIAADYITVEETYEYAMSIDDYTAMVEAEQQKAYEVVSTDDSADIMTADEETTETATTETPKLREQQKRIQKCLHRSNNRGEVG